MPKLVSGVLLSATLVFTGTACGSDSSASSGPTAAGGTGDAFCDANAAGNAVGNVAAFATAPKAEIKTQMDAMVDAAKSMQAAAPAEIKDDVDKVIGTQQRLAALMAEHDYDFKALALDPKVTTLLSDSSYLAAGKRLRTYVDSRCGSATTDTTGS